jgi:hypothetical protein
MSVANEMHELLDRWKGSGTSLMTFGRQERVSYSKLVYWRRKLEGPSSSRRKSPATGQIPELVPVEVVADAKPKRPGFSKFEVLLANGVSLEVASGFDERELRRLVRVLQSC